MSYAPDAAARGTPAAPKKMPNIRTVEEGRICLEKDQLNEPEDLLDSDALAGALVQISLFLGLSQAARDAVHVVAFLMVQPKQARVEDVAVENVVDRVVDRLAEVVKTTTQAAVTEIKSASSALAESSTQMAATATSYWDALTSKGPSPNPIAAAATLDMRVRVREGVKLQQILINARSHGDCILWGISTVGLVDVANAALRSLEHGTDHRFVSAHRLNNRGVVLEMNSEAAIGWLGAPVTRALFLGHFAPDSLVRECAFPLIVQFVPLYFKPDDDSEVRSVEKDNDLPTGSLLHVRWIKPPY